MMISNGLDWHVEHGLDGAGRTFLDSNDGVQRNVDVGHLICQHDKKNIKHTATGPRISVGNLLPVVLRITLTAGRSGAMELSGGFPSNSLRHPGGFKVLWNEYRDG